MGLRRAAGVRSAFGANWASLSCVRELDQRLTQLVPAPGR
jgi:hypothetical protein